MDGFAEWGTVTVYIRRVSLFWLCKNWLNFVFGGPLIDLSKSIGCGLKIEVIETGEEDDTVSGV